MLTRLPPPFRTTADVAHDFIERNFQERIVALPEGRLTHVLAELARLHVVGGAVYDALIGMTAREAGASLVSFDRRAKDTYDRIGVEVELLA